MTLFQDTGAQTWMEGELVLGPVLSSVGSASDAVVYGGGALGASLNAYFTEFNFGMIGLAFPVTMVLGKTPNNPNVTLQRLQIPLGFILSVGDNKGRYGQPGVSGSLTLGYGVNIGELFDNGADFRPFFNVDIAATVLPRGTLKVRYTNVIGSYHQDNGSPVNYHGLFIVGSTRW